MKKELIIRGVILLFFFLGLLYESGIITATIVSCLFYMASSNKTSIKNLVWARHEEDEVFEELSRIRKHKLK